MIRLATEDDAGRMLAIYAPLVRETIISFETESPSLSDMRARIGKTSERFAWLVCEEEGRLLGYAYTSAHRERPAYQWSVDVSVYVDEAARRKGVGRALLTSLLSILRLQGFYNVYAGVALPNPASVGLFQAKGFSEIGVYRNVGYKLGAWRDVEWLQKQLREYGSAPETPVTIREAQKSSMWEAALASGIASLRL